MPASNMGGTGAAPANTGKFVTCDLLSGPKGSPFDKDSAGNYSTGALSTGIGFNANYVLSNAANEIKLRGFTYGYIPGASNVDGTAAADSRFMYIGGGRCTKNVNGIAPPTPYTAGFGIGGFGAGGSRDAGAGPAFTGFALRMSTGAAANGAAIEAGWINRSGVAMTVGQSAFGSGSAATATPV